MALTKARRGRERRWADLERVKVKPQLFEGRGSVPQEGGCSGVAFCVTERTMPTSAEPATSAVRAYLSVKRQFYGVSFRPHRRSPAMTKHRRDRLVHEQPRARISRMTRTSLLFGVLLVLSGCSWFESEPPKARSVVRTTPRIPSYPTQAAANLACSGDTVVWGDSRNLVYELAGGAQYGKTQYGGFMCKQAAEAGGYQLSKNPDKGPEKKPTKGQAH